ncbi:acyl-CoA synthetase [Jatrophihabitans endophyticus]|uniref:acyl-CoA synthetase n=1 Tax=Jatrophihabitans endophyticus TaxID=1206085 RepID=UPI00093243BF|nr:AMP-binding protein [Jatrophihabitans endophyticus]
MRDFVATRPADALALVDDVRDRELRFGEVVDDAGVVAAGLVARGVGKGDVVLVLQGNGADHVALTLACLWLGAPVLPCSEMLRAKDVALRVRRARHALIVADPRNAAALEGLDVPVWWVDDTFAHPVEAVTIPDHAELDDTDPSFVLFTSGTSGEPKLVRHGQRYAWGQRLQAQEWLAARPGELVWSTAAPGWSKSARNCFIAPWWCGAAALVQDRRFDAAHRLDTVRRHGVNVLCMAPTEYRLIAGHGPIVDVPSLRRLVTAGEALGVPAWSTWREQTGLEISDGYGQTETGQVTGTPPGETAPPGSMGRPLPGVRVEVVDGELTVDPSTLPAFFLGYDGDAAPTGRWHTGDTVRQDDDGWLFFEARADDVIISAGYRIGPAEVESTLLGHEAVRECGVVGVPDAERGAVVAAAVVLGDGHVPSAALAAELQAFVRAETAPYKYPRRIWFVDALPKTTSGKLLRSALVPPS